MVTKNGNGGNGMDSAVRRKLSAAEQQAAMEALVVRSALDRCTGAIGATLAFVGPKTDWLPEHRLGAMRQAMALALANGDSFKAALRLDATDPACGPVAAMHDHAIATIAAALEAAGGADPQPPAQCMALGKSLVYAAFVIAEDGAKPEPAVALRVLHAVAAANAAALSPENAAKTVALLGARGDAFLASAAATRPVFEAVRDAIQRGIESLDGVIRKAMPQVQLVR